jgi:hypothetical protein
MIATTASKLPVAFERGLKIGFCGETKIGKSYLGANFVKQFDGVFLDFAGIQQVKTSMKSAPTYDVSHLGKGEAYQACTTVGISPAQYKFIKSWDDLEMAIEYARAYRDNISKKENKRIWLVFDDTTMWRWHEALHACKINSHKSIVKEDWGQATTMMTLRIRQLEAEFNLLFVNQMGYEYVNSENTGNRIGKFWPTSIEFAYDVAGELWIDKEHKPYKQYFKITANRANWLCLDSFVEDVPTPTPESILTAVQVDKDLW